MPVYEYKCPECNKSFDKFFPTISIAEPYIAGYPCECGVLAERRMSQPPKVFFKGDIDRPMYSDPSNPDKM